MWLIYNPAARESISKDENGPRSVKGWESLIHSVTAPAPSTISVWRMCMDQCSVLLPGQESNSSCCTWCGRMKPKYSCCWEQIPSSANWLDTTRTVDTGTISRPIEAKAQGSENEHSWSAGTTTAQQSTDQHRPGKTGRRDMSPSTFMTSSPRNNLVSMQAVIACHCFAVTRYLCHYDGAPYQFGSS
jgi:hypothetical protein